MKTRDMGYTFEYKGRRRMRTGYPGKKHYYWGLELYSQPVTNNFHVM